jgi:hypothetical protein
MAPTIIDLTEPEQDSTGLYLASPTNMAHYLTGSSSKARLAEIILPSSKLKTRSLAKTTIVLGVFRVSSLNIAGLR